MMPFLLSKEVATVRGLPGQKGDYSRLWVDDIPIEIIHINTLFNYYCTDFTWGYVGTGPGFTALAVSSALFLDKHLAGKLACLIEEDFVIKWPFQEPFQEEINLIDFWQRHRLRIEQAIEQAEQDVLYEIEVKKQEEIVRALRERYPDQNRKMRVEVAPTFHQYGPSAEIQWIHYSAQHHKEYSGRIRVDLYRAKKLMILTDIAEIGIQPNFEEILPYVCDKLALNPTRLTLLQRYQWETNLLHQVVYDYDKKRNIFSNPEWHDLSNEAFQHQIDSAELVERQITWTNLLVTNTIRGIITDTSSFIEFNSDTQQYHLFDQVELGFKWGFSGVRDLETAFAICWQFVKHDPSAHVIAPHFLNEYVQTWPEDKNFTCRIRPIDFLLRWKQVLADADYPEAYKLNDSAM